MSVLKLSKNDITKNNDGENKIKINKNQISYDSAMVYGWESKNKDSLNTINNYYTKINNGGYLSADDIKTYRSALDSYISTSNSLRGLDKALGNSYSEDDEKKWTDSISSMNTEYENIYNYYSQFGTEKSFQAHKDYTAKQDYYKKLASSDEGVKGWEQYLADEAKANENESKTPAWLEVINRGFVTANDNPVNMAFNNVVYDYRKDDSYKKTSEQWSEEQKRVFGALWLSDKTEAENYAIETNNAINQAIKDGKVKDIENSATSSFGAGFGHTLGAILTSATGLADIMNNFAEYAARGTITTDSFVTPFEYSQAVTGGISNKLNEMSGTLNDDIPIIGGKGLGDAYGIGTSIVQSAFSAYAFGSTGTLINYFGSGAASAVDDALARGASEEEALGFGVLNGLAEGIPEMFGVDNLFKLGASNTLKSFFINVLKQAGAEGLEEGATSLINAFADNLIMGDKSNYYALVEFYMRDGMSEDEAKRKAWTNYAEDIAFDMVAGAASGGIHGGVHTGVHTLVNNHKTNKIYGDSAQDIVNATREISAEGSKGMLLADKYQKKLDQGKKLTGGQLNELFDTNEQTLRDNDISKMKSATEARLKQLGETGDVSSLADIIVKKASGEQLTRSETNTLNNSRYGQRVSNEISPENIKMGVYTSDWAKGIGTQRINVKEYNAELQRLANEVSGVKNTQEMESSSNVESSQKIAKESEFTWSEDGKTIYNNEDVSVKDISSIKDGAVTVRLEDGREVNAKDVTFSTEDEALMYEMVASLGVSPETAMSMRDIFNKGNGAVSIQSFRNDAPLAYKYGTIEYAKGLGKLGLTYDQKVDLFALGRKDAKAKHEADIAKDKAKVESAKKAQSSEKAKDTTVSKTENVAEKKGRILNEDGTMADIEELKAHAEKDVQKEGIAVIEFLSTVLSGDYYVYESYEKNGKRYYKDAKGNEVYAPNGYFRGADGSLHIDLNAGEFGEGFMINTLAHEQGHYIKRVNKAGFKLLADYIVKYYEETGVDVDALIEERMELMRKRGRLEGLSETQAYDKAFEDVICDGLETIYHDGKVLNMIADLKTTKQGRTVIQQLFDKIKEIINKIVNAYKGVGGVTKAGQEVAKMSLQQMKELQKIFAQALVEADEVYNAINGKTKETNFSDRAESEDSEAELSRLRKEYNEAWNSANEAKKKLDALGKNPNYDEIIKIISDKNASSEDIQKALDLQKKWEEEVGYGKAHEEYDSLDQKARELRRETERMEERLSKALREKKYSEEEVHSIVQKAVRKYRTTSRLNNASYLLTTGSMLDFSDGQGYRVKDHREISEILNLPDYAQYSDGMIVFMNMGNIRLQTYGIDIASMPNDKQISALRGIISDVMREYDEFTVDFSKPNGNSDGSVTYPKGVSSSRIISDIKNYFETGNIPEYDDSLSQFLYSDRDSDGNELSKEQQEFFKDSKVRDEKGKLLVVYHGTSKADFNEFKRNVNFFTDSSEMADSYAPSGEKFVGYLNIKNPFVIDAQGERWSRIPIDAKVKALLEKYGAGTFKEAGKWRTSPADIASAIEEGIDEGELDYDGIIIKNVDDTGRYWKTRDNIVANDYITFKSNQFKNTANKTPTSDPDIRYSDRDLAPTFYSQMGKIVDGMKQDKFAANSVISMLRGRGVKAEEIRWSGIATWLEGKKSVTKQELQEFIAGSQLQIGEQMSGMSTFVDGEGNLYEGESEFKDAAYKKAESLGYDRASVKFMYSFDDDGVYLAYINRPSTGTFFKAETDGSSITSRWEKYKLNGGENYREIVFTLPNSSYSNQMMRTHWGDEAEGVLVHARIQDFVVDGKKMLFIEEIQSDLHNEGRESGYYTDEDIERVDALKAKAHEAFLKVEDYSMELAGSAGEWEFVAKTEEGAKLLAEYHDANEKYKKADNELLSKIPDAPFKENYHEYVLKRLLRMATEQGYDSIGWTPAEIQVKRWSKEFEKAYHIEYDQDMPKFLKKYGRQWGAKVENTKAPNGEDIWSMDITDSMKDSVLHEGQVLYSDRGVNKYGIEVYETSEKTKNLPYKERQKAFLDIMQNQYRGRTAKFIRNGHAYYARFEEADVRKNIYGDKRSDYKGVKAKVNVGADGNIFELVENAQYDGSKHEQGKTSVAHQKVAYWDYFIKTVQIDNKVFDLLANVRKKSDGGYVYSIQLNENKKVEASPPLIPSKGVSNRVLNASTDDTITQKNRFVKSLSENSENKFSDRDPELAAQREKVNEVLEKENAKLKEDNQYLKELVKLQRKVTHGTKFTKSSVQIVASRLMKYASAKGNRAELVNLLNEFYGYIAEGNDLTWESVAEKAQPAIDWLKNNVSRTEKLDAYSREVLNTIRSKRIYLDEQQQAEAAYVYGSFNEYRKKAMGSLTLVSKDNPQGATSLDSQWQEFAEKYPELFDADMNSNEMPMKLLEIVTDIRDFKHQSNEYEYADDMIEQDLLAKVYDGYWDVSTLHTVADSMQKDITKLKIQHHKKMAEVREYHNEKHSQLKQEYQEKIARIREDYRERNAKTTRELMDRYQESRAKAIEGRHKTEYRNKIKRVVGDLNQLLLRPTKDKHVKEALRQAVAEALSAINMDTIGAEERVAKYNELIAKTSDPDMIAELTQTRDRIELQGENLKEKLTALQTAYEKIKKSTDTDLVNAYQEPVMNAIKNVVEMVGNTSIRDMSITQLEAVYEMYSMILHTVRTANKAFKAQKGETITQISEAVNNEIRKNGKEKFARTKLAKVLRKTGWTLLKPFTAFRTMGSETFTGLYKNLRNGEDVFYTDVNEAKTFIQDMYKKHSFDSWDKKKTYTFKAKSGKTFTLTLDQVMSMYAYSRRHQAHDHIIEGGIVLEDAVIEEKKFGIPVKYEVDTKSAFNISEETLQEICDSLTDEQRAFVEDMQTYLSDVMGAKGNEVSMELLGVKLFKEKFYFPLKSSKYYMGFKPEEAGEIKLKNSSFSKETVQHANNPVVLQNFTDVWATHVNDMSMYHAFVLPLEDFTRVYNYKTPTAEDVETMSTEATIANAYGEGATKYIRNFLKSLNGGVRTDGVDFADKAISLTKKGAVLASASVAIQQPSAIMRAMALINPIHFVATTHKSINLVKHNRDWAELKTYAPIAGIKEMGGYDIGMGQGTVDWIKNQSTFREKVDDVLGKAPAFMDEVTWVSIWNAVKREVASTNKDLKVDSEEFLKKAGERFTEVITFTQVYDSVFSRSDIMRNANPLAKMLTAFMAESSTTLNMLWDAGVQGKRTGSVGGFVKSTAGTTGAVIASVVFNAALKSIITAMRDDDDEETYAEKYIGNFVGDTIDGLNPLMYIPFVKDIVSIFKGYDVGRMDMDLFADLYKAIDAFDSESKSGYEKWTGLIGAISAFTGIPYKNVERDIRGAFNTIKSFAEGENTTKAGIGIAIREGWTGKEISNKQQLYEAYLSDDKEQIKRVEGRFDDKSEMEAALRKALRENDSRINEAAKAVLNGNHKERIRLTKEIVAEGHFKQDIVVAAINAELNYLKQKIKEEEEKKKKKENG